MLGAPGNVTSLELEETMQNTLPVYGERLRERRLAAGMTQADAGRVVGVLQSQISNLESGWSRPPALALAVRLARTYNTSVDYLLGLTDNPLAVGKTLPPQGEEVLALLDQLPARRRAELLGVARQMLASELSRRAEEEVTIREFVQMLEEFLPGETWGLLFDEIAAALSSGDAEAIKRIATQHRASDAGVDGI